MKKLSLLIFLINIWVSFSQSKFQIEVNFGYAFQSEVTLNNETLESNGAFGIRFGVNYIKMINDKLYMETGIYGKYNRGNREIETLNFVFNSLKIQLPLYAGYKMNDVWKISLGASIENNRYSHNLDFTQEDNLRYDFLTKLVYAYTTKVDLSFYTNWMLNYTPDSFTIISPKNGIYLGLIYKLGKTTKIKKD